MTIARGLSIKSGDSPAIRLPETVAYEPDVELVIERSGDVMTIYPLRTSVGSMLAELKRLPVPPAVEERDTTEFSERPGL